MNRNATWSQLSNQELFELQNFESLGISKELCDFLNQTQYPWKSLGKACVQFVEYMVAQVSPHLRLQGNIHPGAWLENKDQIVVEPGATIEAGAFVCGPTYIEAGAVVRHGAYVRGGVYISRHCIVGHTTECKGSIFLPHAKAAHFNYVGDSILGVHCNLGAGTKLANLKINHASVSILIEGKKTDTGLKKFGAILGNRAQTGCNAVTNPGTIFLKDKFILPNETALGVIL
jgi:NDP-sugar pyrophosphorylase family protein